MLETFTLACNSDAGDIHPSLCYSDAGDIHSGMCYSDFVDEEKDIRISLL